MSQVHAMSIWMATNLRWLTFQITPWNETDRYVNIEGKTKKTQLNMKWKARRDGNREARVAVAIKTLWIKQLQFHTNIPFHNSLILSLNRTRELYNFLRELQSCIIRTTWLDKCYLLGQLLAFKSDYFWLYRWEVDSEEGTNSTSHMLWDIFSADGINWDLYLCTSHIMSI